jgi:hypothetical protein
MGDKRGTYSVFGGKPNKNRQLGRPGRRQEDSIRMDLQEMDWRSMHWIDLAQDRDRLWALENALMKLRIP